MIGIEFHFIVFSSTYFLLNLAEKVIKYILGNGILEDLINYKTIMFLGCLIRVDVKRDTFGSIFNL